MDLADLADGMLLDSKSYIGIPLALLGAVFLSLGTQLQHAGVAKVDAAQGSSRAGLGWDHFKALIMRPSWIVGTAMLGLAIVLQLGSLWFAPIIVVQPIGAVALVITAILNSRLAKVPLDRPTITSIALCMAGVGVFVTIAAFFGRTHPITAVQLGIVVGLLSLVLVVWLVLFMLFRNRGHALFYIIGAGMLFGFVATLAKVVMGRIQTLLASKWQFGGEEWLTIICIFGLIAASLVGSYFVQTAHANGPPDLVVAGLTVVDPIIAVAIGSIVLGEASGAPVWAVFAFGVSGAVAVFGVFQLSKHHPQMSDEFRATGKLPFQRGSGEEEPH